MFRRLAFDRPYASPWKVWLPVLVFFVVADVTFDAWFWRIPKLTGTNADFGYQFLVDAQPLRRPAAAGTRRVVAFGSSVSGSFDPRQVQSLLQAAGTAPIEVHRLLLPAAHPTDYVMYFEGGRMPAPDVVVVLFNLVDFLFAGSAGDINPTLRYALPPGAIWREHRSALAVADQLDLFVAATSDIYRYRRPLRSSLQDHVRALARWARSRPSSRPYGIFADGFTHRRFGLAADASGRLRLRFEVADEWLRQRGRVGMTISVAGRVVAAHEIAEPGWHEFESTLQPGQRADVEFDSTWSPRAAGADDLRLLGGRLDAGLIPAAGAPAPEPFRWRPRTAADIDTFLRMGGERGAAYLRRWHDVMEAPTRFGQRFRVYRDAKAAVRDQEFAVNPDYAAVERIARFFAAQGTRVVLINTPESPLMLAAYGESPYYAAYRRYFADIAAAVPGVRFVDLSDALPAEAFNDLHHPTFVGAIALGPRYAEIVRDSLASRDDRP